MNNLSSKKCFYLDSSVFSSFSSPSQCKYYLVGIEGQALQNTELERDILGKGFANLLNKLSSEPKCLSLIQFENSLGREGPLGYGHIGLKRVHAELDIINVDGIFRGVNSVRVTN